MRKTHARLYVRDKTRVHERTHAARSSAQAAEHLPLPTACRPARTASHWPMANGGLCGLQWKRMKFITIKHFKAFKHNRALQAQSSTSRPLKTFKHNRATKVAPTPQRSQGNPC